jgi:hypothetical protein
MVEPADIKGPLVQFHATKAEKQDTKKLVNTINRALGAESLPDEKVDKAFEKWWPDLEKSLSSISILESTPRTGRSDREILEEILELIRAEARESREFSQTRDNFMSLWLQLLESSLRHDPNVKPETAKALYDLFRTTIQVRQDRPPAPPYTDRGLLWTRQDFEGRNEEEIFGFFEKELMPEAVERARRDWEYVEARDLPNKVMTLAMSKAKAKAEELGLAERWEQWLRGRSPE